MYLGSQIQRNGIYWPYRLQEKVKAKESHIKKHKHNQLGKHKDSEHEALIRLRTENKLFKAENAAKKK